MISFSNELCECSLGLLHSGLPLIDNPISRIESRASCCLSISLLLVFADYIHRHEALTQCHGAVTVSSHGRSSEKNVLNPVLLVRSDRIVNKETVGLRSWKTVDGSQIIEI